MTIWKIFNLLILNDVRNWQIQIWVINNFVILGGECLYLLLRFILSFTAIRVSLFIIFFCSMLQSTLAVCQTNNHKKRPFLTKAILMKIWQNWGWKQYFWRQKSKIWPKIENLVKNKKIGQKSKIWLKTENLIEN